MTTRRPDHRTECVARLHNLARVFVGACQATEDGTIVRDAAQWLMADCDLDEEGQVMANALVDAMAECAAIKLATTVVAGDSSSRSG